MQFMYVMEEGGGINAQCVVNAYCANNRRDHVIAHMWMTIPLLFCICTVLPEYSDEYM